MNDDPSEPAKAGVQAVPLQKSAAPVEAAWDDFFDAPGIDLAARVQPDLDEGENVTDT